MKVYYTCTYKSYTRFVPPPSLLRFIEMPSFSNSHKINNDLLHLVQPISDMRQRYHRCGEDCQLFLLIISPDSAIKPKLT